MSDDYIVKPVAKALLVLITLGESERELSLPEICGLVGIPKTTVYRYLQTLVAYGFVRHDRSLDKYGPGLRIWSLGQSIWSRTRLQEVATEAMEQLRLKFDETVNLGVIDGKEIVYIGMAESRRALRMHARLGGRDPIYSTSLGRAIIALMPEDEWSQYLPARLTPRTSKTIVSIAALRSDLAETERRGYALDDGENEENARCIGAPILDGGGRPIAAISLSVPTSRLGDDRIDHVAAEVRNTAMRISLLLGYQP